MQFTFRLCFDSWKLKSVDNRMNHQEEYFQKELDFVLKLILKQRRNVKLCLLQELFKNVTSETRKNQREVYEMTKNAIKKWSFSLNDHFMKFINLSKEDDSDSSVCDFFDVAYELRDIYPGFVGTYILRDAVIELKSKNVDVRLRSTNFVGKFIFDTLDKMIPKKENYLRIFLHQLRDECDNIQSITSNYVKNIFLKYPTARILITKYLENLKHSPERPTLRIVAISLLTNIICKKIEILQENTFFRNFVLNLITDSEYSVRKMELTSLGIIFNHYIGKFEELTSDLRKILLSIESKLLHEFSIRKNLDDRIFIEELFFKYFVSFQLPTATKVKRFFHFYVSLHPLIVENFEEFQLEKIRSQELLQLWVKLMTNQSKDREKIMEKFQQFLCEKNCLMKSMLFVEEFEDFLKINQSLVNEMEKICLPNVSCQEAIQAFENSENILNRSKAEDRDVFLKIIKKGTPFLFDNDTIQVLINYLLQVFNNDTIAKELNLDPSFVLERGIKLLNVMSDCYPKTLENEDFLTTLIQELNRESICNKNYLILKLLVNIGNKMPLCNIIESNSTLKFLIVTCQRFAIKGTKNEAKMSIKCIKFSTKNCDHPFDEILTIMKSNWSAVYFLKFVVPLGQIANARPIGKCPDVEFLIQEVFEFIRVRGTLGLVGMEGNIWCSENDLSVGERRYEESIKCIGRWISGLDFDSEFFRFHAKQFLIIVKRHLFEPFSKTEPRRNRLRSISACIVLKLCKIPQFRLCLPVEFFYHLSQLMNDECPQVSNYFINKLIKLLKENSASQFLPNEFLAFFILLRGESKFIEDARKEYELIVEQRNIFVRYVLERTKDDSDWQETFCQDLFEWIPEFSLIPGLLILTHDSNFKECEDLSEKDLKYLYRILWIFLEPIIDKGCFNCANLFERITRKIGQSFEPKFPHMKEKLWTLNHLILSMIHKKQIKSNKTVFNENSDINFSKMFNLMEMSSEELV